MNKRKMLYQILMDKGWRQSSRRENIFLLPETGPEICEYYWADIQGRGGPQGSYFSIAGAIGICINPFEKSWLKMLEIYPDQSDVCSYGSFSRQLANYRECSVGFFESLEDSSVNEHFERIVKRLNAFPKTLNELTQQIMTSKIVDEDIWVYMGRYGWLKYHGLLYWLWRQDYLSEINPYTHYDRLTDNQKIILQVYVNNVLEIPQP
ncbi:hypothetical protein [Paremcibacter congregatus]|uniref:Uncharacterized protein n=1 Tax=Paremcibacter congregatus TaxID=2043170 RepID=A0A2G4YWP6_9PROT|nr:hypothetical protein [Paremcibacter congregatus]PHZ86758.1 hypothetical protein CRD36_00040 [Paremcibacter congregatus]QDE28964.1 hypothetical protein FIV45_17605 [Paremcibacter congregatus]